MLQHVTYFYGPYFLRRCDAVANRERRLKLSGKPVDDKVPLRTLFSFLSESLEEIETSIDSLSAPNCKHLEPPCRIINAWVVLLCALAGKRLCEALALRVSEIRAAERRDLEFVVRIAGGKNANHSCTFLVLNSVSYRLLSKLADIRESQGQDFLLRTSTLGKPSNAILGPVWKRCSLEPFTVNDLRKIVESHKFLLAGTADSSAANAVIPMYLGHNTAVAAKFYTLKSAESIIAAHRLLNGLLFQIVVIQGLGEQVLEHSSKVMTKEELAKELESCWENAFLRVSPVTECTLNTVVSRLRERARIQLVKDTLESYRAWLRGPEVNSTSTVKDFLPSKLPFPLNDTDRQSLYCELQGSNVK